MLKHQYRNLQNITGVNYSYTNRTITILIKEQNNRYHFLSSNMVRNFKKIRQIVYKIVFDKNLKN